MPSTLVLSGGPDAERPVSLVSGAAVAQALRDDGAFEVLEAVIDRPGADELAALGGDVIFPVLHGRWGEGGGLQAELDRAGVPYVGSGARASARAMDKLATKQMLAPYHVATPPSRELRPGAPCDLQPPVVLKPVDDGSSVDLVVCRTRDELESARRRLELRRPRLMAERLAAGREITVGLLHGETLPLVEIVAAGGLYDYDAKYERDDTRYVLDPDLPEAVAATCRRVALLAWRVLGCRDLARADFIVEGDVAWFLEINTMPGFTPHSLLPMAARRAGIEMGALCRGLVEAALARGADVTARTPPAGR